MDLGLKDRVALITGAGGGIGASIAQALCAEGAHVALADIDEKAANTQANILRDAGYTAVGIRMDVTDKAGIDAAVDQAVAELGTIDILVNNAGFTRDMRLGKMEEADWDSVCDVILKGTYLCTRAVLQGMIDKRWGRIVNSSSRAHLGNPGQANYSAAKAGVIGFTRAMSLENGKFGVTANAVAPGIINTAAVTSLRHYDKIKENAERNLPVRRIGEVEEVASVVTFLASERASYISGDVIHVTGGRY